MPGDARRGIYYGGTLLVSLGVISIIAYGTLQYFFGVLVVPVERELGWSRAQLALGSSIALLVSGLLGYPIGRWVDRKEARGILASGALLGGVALIGLSRVGEPWQWRLLWGGAGAGRGHDPVPGQLRRDGPPLRPERRGDARHAATEAHRAGVRAGILSPAAGCGSHRGAGAWPGAGFFAAREKTNGRPHRRPQTSLLPCPRRGGSRGVCS